MKIMFHLVIWISFLMFSAAVYGQIQFYYNTNAVASGSVQQSTLALGQNDNMNFEFENTSSVAKNYFILRNRMTYPSCWSHEYINWESLETGGYCYPTNESLIWETYNSILIQPGERARLEDYYIINCDSCGYFRYSVFSEESGFEDSLDMQICSVAGTNENIALSFSIYPNPAINTLMINGDVSEAEFHIVDANGAKQPFLIISQTPSFLLIDMSRLQVGSYFLQGYDASGKSLFNRSIIKRSSL